MSGTLTQEGCLVCVFRGIGTVCAGRLPSVCFHESQLALFVVRPRHGQEVQGRGACYLEHFNHPRQPPTIKRIWPTKRVYDRQALQTPQTG